MTVLYGSYKGYDVQFYQGLYGRVAIHTKPQLMTENNQPRSWYYANESNQSWLCVFLALAALTMQPPLTILQ